MNTVSIRRRSLATCLALLIAGNVFAQQPIEPPYAIAPSTAGIGQLPLYEGTSEPLRDPNQWELNTIPVSAFVDPLAPTVANEVDPMDERLKKIEKRLDEADKAKKKLPNVTINGVFQADAVLFNQTPQSRDQFGYIENGADFRRARLSAKGSVYENVNYFFQMDFGFFGRPTFTDVWVEQTKLPYLGTVRIGQWKQPFGLETVSSFRYTTFMERSSLFQAFVPFRHLGIGFYDNAEDLNSTWAASYFRTGQDQFGDSLSTVGGNGMSARATHLMWYSDCGDEYLHLGAGYFLNSPPRNTARFRSIPEIFVGEFAGSGTVGTSGQATPAILNGTPFFVDTGNIANVKRIDTFGTEALWVQGPLSWQTEGMLARVNQTGTADATLGGMYTQVGYFLTGEHRPYDRKAGAIDRVMPLNSFKRGGGLGAWEIAARWSYLDLTDKNIFGGTMQNFTAGINWYTNPNCKIVFNYIHSWVEGKDLFPVATARALNSQTDAFGMRAQVDF